MCVGVETMFDPGDETGLEIVIPVPSLPLEYWK